MQELFEFFNKSNRKNKVGTKSSKARRSRIFLKHCPFWERLHFHYAEEVPNHTLLSNKEGHADPRLVPLKAQRGGNVA